MSTVNELDVAREKWFLAKESAVKFAASIHQTGSGYGDPEARLNDDHQLQTLRYEAERLFIEYQEICSQETNKKLIKLQKSQSIATWASFAVAAMVGLSTIVQAYLMKK